MELRTDKLDPLLARLDGALLAASPNFSAAAVERWRADAGALRFHLRRRPGGASPPLLAIVGGTGTGKSTLVNRLLGQNLSAASFRRTFTSGPVALSQRAAALPEGWLGVEHVPAGEAEVPARGRIGALIVVPVEHELTRRLTLIDTPDLDGDQPAHHAQADRAFRWADAVLFLVTPEKYQMTELLPYYRLAQRYAVPTLYVMNKCEEGAVLDDYRAQLAGGGFVPPDAAPDPAAQPVAQGADQGAGPDPAPPPPPAIAPRPRTSPFAVPALSPGAAIIPGSANATPAPASQSAPAGQAAPGEPAGARSSRVFAIPRDDAAYEPPPGANLPALRATLLTLAVQPTPGRQEGLRNRAADLLGRFADQILAPLRQDRSEADRLVDALRGMEAPAPGVDVNPLTQQLQRRLQQRSILYLMGPGRMLDRARQAPGLFMRLPRVAWDYVKTGEVSAGSLSPAGGGEQSVPDFRGMLVDQFAVLQSRIDDALRSEKAGERWLAEGEKPYHSARVAPDEAGKIVDEEMADLKDWLEKRWNATPRDTKALQSLLKYLPGATKLARWSEAAPYLLTVVLITHGAIFGHIDLMVLGGYGLATWLTERLSNEVASRTRATNARIAERFTRLAHEQIERVCAWLDKQAPSARTLDQLERLGHDAAETLG